MTFHLDAIQTGGYRRVYNEDIINKTWTLKNFGNVAQRILHPSKKIFIIATAGFLFQRSKYF